MQSASAPDEPIWLWSAMDPAIASSLSSVQKTAIAQAALRHDAQHPPADVRLSFGRYFLVFICGRERRADERLRAERQARPVFTLRNAPLLVGLWGSVIYTAYSAFGLVVKTLFAAY